MDYNNNQTQPVEHPMKWHKFLIYFSLWASAVINLLQGINMISYTSYHVLNGVYGVVLIVIAVMCIVTRFALAGYKANGPKLLTTMYVVSAIASLVFSLLVGSINGTSMDSTVISNVASSLVWAFVNRSYYAKRSDLFIN